MVHELFTIADEALLVRTHTHTHGYKHIDLHVCTLISSHSYALWSYRRTCRRSMNARNFSTRCATFVEFARTLLSPLSSISVYETAVSRTPYHPLAISLPRFVLSTCSLFSFPLTTRRDETNRLSAEYIHSNQPQISTSVDYISSLLFIIMA